MKQDCKHVLRSSVWISIRRDLSDQQFGIQRQKRQTIEKLKEEELQRERSQLQGWEHNIQRRLGAQSAELIGLEPFDSSRLEETQVRYNEQAQPTKRPEKRAKSDKTYEEHEECDNYGGINGEENSFHDACAIWGECEKISGEENENEGGNCLDAGDRPKKIEV